MLRWLLGLVCKREIHFMKQPSKPNFVRFLVAREAKAKRSDYWSIYINLDKVVSIHAQAGIKAAEDEDGCTIILEDETTYYILEEFGDLEDRLGFSDDDEDEDDDDNEDEEENTDDDPPTLTKDEFETSFNAN